MVKLISHENNKAIFEHTVEFDLFKEKLKEAYEKNKSRFNIPGFRKGKAPRVIIENNYGKDIFYNDALDILLPEVYSNAIEELKLSPVSTPQVDIDGQIEEGKDILLKFEVETFPEIELADYSKIEVEKFDDEISEDLVKARIDEEIQKNKVIKSVDREVIEGDIVNIDFEGFKDGEAFEGGKAEAFDLEIGSGQFIPGFEEKLIGSKKGDELDIELTFPEDYPSEDLKGQDVVFKVKINEVTEEIYPELDDDFVMDVSEFDTVEEYENSIREKIKEEREENHKIQVENEIVEELIRRTEFDVPNQMIEDQLDEEVHEFEHQLSHMGMDMKTYLSITQSSEEDLRKELREKAENKLRMEIILDALVEDREFEISDEEVQAEYDEVAKQYNREGDEDFMKLVKAQVSEDAIKNVLKRRKVLDELKQDVVYVERKEEVEEENEEESE